MTKSKITIILTILFSILFYHQNSGINVFIFDLCLLVFCCLHYSPTMKNRNFWYSSAALLISAFSVAWYGDGFSVIVNLFTLTLVAMFANHPNSSILFTPFQSALSLISSPFYWLRKLKMGEITFTKIEQGNSRFLRIIILIVAPILTLLAFLKLYMSANPIFENMIGELDLDFISFGSVSFTLFGAFLIYNFFTIRKRQFLNQIEEKTREELNPQFALSPQPTLKQITLTQEINLGAILFLLLNTMLLLVLSIDFKYLILETQLPEGISHSQYVHQSVGSVITSIVFAVLLILFFYKGSLNFAEKTKLLKTNTLIWIGLNLLLVVATTCKNHLYISSYGLTMKRLGVDIYLLLSSLGLGIACLKIILKKSNWFLIKKTYWAFFTVMVLSTPINWSYLITKYNIELYKKNNVELDVNYLLNLSEHGITAWIPLLENIPENLTYGKENLQNKLSTKIYNFLTEHSNKDFRSLTLGDEIYRQELINLQLHTLKLNYFYNQKLNYFPCFKNIRKLNLALNNDFEWEHIKLFSKVEELNLSDNSLNHLKNIPLSKNLKKLELQNNNLYSLNGLQHLKKLEYLNLDCNSVSDYTPIFNLTNLKELHVSSASKEQLAELENYLTTTKIYPYPKK
ncbi:MAG: DUF4153 domain-containing protein [Marinifilaceae bacterium]